MQVKKMLQKLTEPTDISEFIEPQEVEKENGFAFIGLFEPRATKFYQKLLELGITPYDVEIIEDDYENEVIFTLKIEDYEENFQ
jgi:hypothetical protein